MSKYQWIIVLGVWVAVFLFLGFPSSWSPFIAVITGLIIVLVAYNGSRKQIRQIASTSNTSAEKPREDSTNTYVENH